MRKRKWKRNDNKRVTVVVLMEKFNFKLISLDNVEKRSIKVSDKSSFMVFQNLTSQFGLDCQRVDVDCRYKIQTLSFYSFRLLATEIKKEKKSVMKEFQKNKKTKKQKKMTRGE